METARAVAASVRPVCVLGVPAACVAAVAWSGDPDPREVGVQDIHDAIGDATELRCQRLLAQEALVKLVELEQALLGALAVRDVADDVDGCCESTVIIEDGIGGDLVPTFADLQLHGLAAQRLARAHGQVAVHTTQLLDYLPSVLRRS